MTIPILGGAPYPFLPYSNITPFTASAGSTYLEVLEQLRTYIKDILVPSLDLQVTDLAIEWGKNVDSLILAVDSQLALQDAGNAAEINSVKAGVDTKIVNLTTYVNTAISGIITSSIATSDPVMTGVFDNVTTIFRSRLVAMFAPINNPSFTGNVTGVTKSHVGLSNVDNISDANKPVSTPQATADNVSKARVNHTGTQLANTVSDFSAAVAAVADTRNLSGAYADRPAANAVSPGTLYYCTNVPETYRSNGAAWRVIGSGGNELGYATNLTGVNGVNTTDVAIAGCSVTFVAGERPLGFLLVSDVANSLSTGLTTVSIALDGAVIRAIVSLGIGADVWTTTSGSARNSGLTPGSTHTATLVFRASAGTTARVAAGVSIQVVTL